MKSFIGIVSQVIYHFIQIVSKQKNQIQTLKLLKYANLSV